MAPHHRVRPGSRYGASPLPCLGSRGPSNYCSHSGRRIDASGEEPNRTTARRRRYVCSHFVGDVHQPLHAADNRNKGGNATRVVLDGRRTNLHAVWDVDMVRALGRSPEEISAQLEREITPADIRMWQMGNGLDWAIESFRIASREIYGKLAGPGDTDAPIILPAGYTASESAVVRQQLEKAGVRLAWVLNEALR
jgi:hypothetical protein